MSQTKEKKDPVVIKLKPIYDPAKQYNWPNDAKFELTGDQFGLWLNSVRAKISSKEAMEYRIAFESNIIIEKIMAAGVESGVIVEGDASEKKK